LNTLVTNAVEAALPVQICVVETVALADFVGPQEVGARSDGEFAPIYQAPNFGALARVEAPLVGGERLGVVVCAANEACYREGGNALQQDSESASGLGDWHISG
jgi:hypothetical protein